MKFFNSDTLIEQHGLLHSPNRVILNKGLLKDYWIYNAWTVLEFYLNCEVGNGLHVKGRLGGKSYKNSKCQVSTAQWWLPNL